jgi:hypothetical protein
MIGLANKDLQVRLIDLHRLKTQEETIAIAVNIYCQLTWMSEIYVAPSEAGNFSLDKENWF